MSTGKRCTRSWTGHGELRREPSSGADRAQVCIGDPLRWGDVLLQVVGALAAIASTAGLHPELAQVVQDSGRCGWFYRVLKPGFVDAELPFELVQRGYPSLSVARALQHFYHCAHGRAGLQQLQLCPALSARWREIAAQRLRSGRLKNWSARLLGLPLENCGRRVERRYA